MTSDAQIRRGPIRRYKAVTVNGFKATLFASTSRVAAGIFIEHHEANLGTSPPEFTIERLRGPRRPGLAKEYLEDALARKVAGVGYLLWGRGWSIHPGYMVMELREENLVES